MRLLSASRSAKIFLGVVLAAAVSVTACKTTSQSSTGSSTQTAASGNTNPGTTSGSGSVTALQPTQVSFGGASRNSEPAPNITAKAAILVDQYGRVIYEKNADTRLPVASTQKLLLGIMIAERGNLGQPVTIQAADTWAEPTKMGIKQGEVYTREELLHTVLIRSSNDIARALARDHSGSVSAFAANMNVRARQLGMHNSYFTNASGLPTPPGQYSTARDLAKLGAASLKNSFVRNSIRTQYTTFRFSNGTPKTVYNTNQVLRNFPYCTGAKTGYTNAAGRCLVSSATHGRKSVIAVILGSKTPNVWTESEALLRYGLGL